SWSPARSGDSTWAVSLVYVSVHLVVVGAAPLLQAPRGEVILQAVYQGIGVAIAALVLYFFAIRILGASVASLFMPLTPVFGVLLGVPILGEVPSPVQLLGMLAASIGMMTAT